MNRFLQHWISLPKAVVTALALVLTAALGIVDYLTGRDVSMSVFYLIPICWAAWVSGRKAGLFVAMACVIAWLISDLMTGETHPLVPYWNGLVLLLTFWVVVYLLTAFQAAHHHLEETVQRRTAALEAEVAARKRLEMAKVQAERLAAVGTMAAKVAHEVRNPLGSITLNLDLIRKELDKLAESSRHPPKEGRVLVNEMREEVHRIQHVIQDYLQFARLPKLQRRSLALNDLLDQKIAFMQASFDKAKVKWRTEFDPSPAIVNADADQLWQAILNLISNGLEAMPDGGILTVGTERDGAQAALRITDTGKGMTDEQVRQVFAPFFSTKAQGTGLGLSLAQQIVTEHGGHIECVSAVGKGSTFTIYLPLAEKS